MEVLWCEDNRTLLFSQTVKGWPNWFKIGGDGKSSEQQITNDLKTNRSITSNKKHTKAVYLCGRDEVKIIDLKTFKVENLVKEELWGFQNSIPHFSPNDEYVVFTAYRNFEQDILVHHIKDKKTFNLTNTGVTERQPFWSPCGKYIYFSSDRSTFQMAIQPAGVVPQDTSDRNQLKHIHRA